MFDSFAGYGGKCIIAWSTGNSILPEAQWIVHFVMDPILTASTVADLANVNKIRGSLVLTHTVNDPRSLSPMASFSHHVPHHGKHHFRVSFIISDGIIFAPRS